MIRGKGKYTGTLSKSFQIQPKATKLSKCVPAAKQITAYWNKQAKQTTGYQIQCCTKSTFKSGVKTVTIKKSSKTSGKLTGLKAATTYYLRVRTYKTVGSKKLYSSWSSKKTVRTKAAAAGKTGTGAVVAAPSPDASDGDSADTQLIANKNTKKFHRSTCSSVKKMSEKNKWYVDCPRSELINKGYDPCKICKP